MRGSLALFVDIPDKVLIPQKLVGNMDKQNIFHFSINRKAYVIIVKELLKLVYENKHSIIREISIVQKDHSTHVHRLRQA